MLEAQYPGNEFLLNLLINPEKIYSAIKKSKQKYNQKTLSFGRSLKIYYYSKKINFNTEA